MTVMVIDYTKKEIFLKQQVIPHFSITQSQIAYESIKTVKKKILRPVKELAVLCINSLLQGRRLYDIIGHWR